MSRVLKSFSLLFLLLGVLTPLAAEGVAPSAAKLVDFGHGWAITNAMATGWTISALLVALVLWLIGRPSVVPSKGQAVFEALIDNLREIFEPIVGKAAFPTALLMLSSTPGLILAGP